MILLGLTGSVATILYKKIIASLQQIDPHIEVILTKDAQSFVSMKELEEMHIPVWTDHDEWVWCTPGSGPTDPLYVESRPWKKDDRVLHIELRDRASEFVIAPITANTMGKLANGLCDNLLTSVARAWDPKKPMILAPAMNTQMWEHPITEKHIETLHQFRYRIVYPQRKMLACGYEGMGALADIEKIAKSVVNGRGLDKWWFPLAVCSGIPVNPHPGAFGYMRRESRHTGVDLYTQDGFTVTAVEAGKVVCIEHFTGEQDGSPWWNNTECILVEGKSGVVCYGEVTPKGGLRVGDTVRIGESIANVKRVIKEGRERPDIPGHSPSMLHLELYPKGIRHPSCGFESHLIDPTQFLIESKPPFVQLLVYDGYKPSQH